MPLQLFPRDELVVVFEAGDERVIELPIVPELIPPTGCGDSIGVIDRERPTADTDLVSAIVERLAGPPCSEPMPVVRLDIVPVCLARSRALPQVPIENGGNGNWSVLVGIAGLATVEPDLFDAGERAHDPAERCGHTRKFERRIAVLEAMEILLAD